MTLKDSRTVIFYLMRSDIRGTKTRAIVEWDLELIRKAFPDWPETLRPIEVAPGIMSGHSLMVNDVTFSFTPCLELK